MLCPNCGREIANEASVCGGCGRPLVVARTDAPPTQVYGPKSGKGGIGLILLIIGCVTVALGFLVEVAIFIVHFAGPGSFSEDAKGMLMVSLACPLPLIVIGGGLLLIGVLMRVNKPKPAM